MGNLALLCTYAKRAIQSSYTFSSSYQTSRRYSSTIACTRPERTALIRAA
jgi:hypothetical protein